MKILIPISCIIILLNLSACHDIFEDNISKKQVTLLAPGDMIKTSILTQTFWWDKLDGATKYNLQIVSGSFDANTIFVLDTNVTGTKFSFSLSPGTYQWKLIAKNVNYSTSSSIRSFTIDSSGSISFQKILLNTPLDGTYLNTLNDLSFKWYELSLAKSYGFQLTNSASGIIIDTSGIPGTSVTVKLSSAKEGNYSWRVKAEGDSGLTSAWSAYGNFTIDTTRPVISSFSVTKRTTDTSVAITWARTDNIGILEDLVYAGQDSSGLFAATAIEISNSSTSYTYKNKAIIGKAYFGLRSKDKAGNFSNNSAIKVITLP